MNSNQKTILVIAALIVTAAATVSQGRPDKNPSSPEARKAVLIRLDEIQKAAEGLDPDKVFSFVLENDAGALAQNGRLFLSRSDALDATRKGFQALQKVDYRFDQQHVTMLSETIALAIGEGSSSATMQDGASFTTRFAQSVVLVLTNGEWKVLHAHRSFPPAR